MIAAICKFFASLDWTSVLTIFAAFLAGVFAWLTALWSHKLWNKGKAGLTTRGKICVGSLILWTFLTLLLDLYDRQTERDETAKAQRIAVDTSDKANQSAQNAETASTNAKKAAENAERAANIGVNNTEGIREAVDSAKNAAVSAQQGVEGLKRVLTAVKHQQFSQQLSNPVTDVTFFVALDKPYPVQRIGDYELLLSAYMADRPGLFVSSQGGVAFGNVPLQGYRSDWGVLHAAWTEPNDHGIDTKPDFNFQDEMPEGKTLEARTSKGGAFGRLLDFDKARIVVHVSETLWPQVAAIGLAVNGYVILHQPRSCLSVSDTLHGGNPTSDRVWPAIRRPSDDTKWVMLVPGHYKSDGNVPPKLGFRVDFSEGTPVSMKEITDAMTAELAIPKCDWYGDKKP